MKTWKLSTLAFALLLATFAFAANKAPMQVLNPVSVSGKQLAAGDYTVSWEGNGPAVEVSILKGKNVIAKVPAKMVDLPQAPSRNSIITTNNAGVSELVQIQFNGKKWALKVGD